MYWRMSMLGRLVVSSVAILLLASNVSSQGLVGRGNGGANSNPRVFPPNSHPYGLSYAEWQARDWQLSFATPYDPEACVLGVVGRFGDTMDVLHLNVSLGTPVVYTCTIPTGAAILIPVLTAAYGCPTYCGPGQIAPNGTEEELAVAVRADIDLVSVLEVEIDGRPLQNLFAYRFFSPSFFGTAVEGNLSGYVGPYGPAVADGYYVMLAPLPAGDHAIHVLGVVGDPADPLFEADSTFFITVAPGAPAVASEDPDGTTLVVPGTWSTVKKLYR